MDINRYGHCGPDPESGTEFRQKILDRLQLWKTLPPTRDAYLQATSELTAWRAAHRHPGIWPLPPLMVTAAIDDGWGHGIGIIEKLAAADIRIHAMGLLQTPESIVSACPTFWYAAMPKKEAQRRYRVFCETDIIHSRKTALHR